MTPELWLRWFPVLLRYGALAGVFYETVFEQFDRPYLLALFGAMLGIGEVGAGLAKVRRDRDREATEDAGR